MAIQPKELIAFLGRIEKLKCNTRHAWTSSGRHETVAAHSWRLTVMTLLLRDEIPGVDFQKVMEMCLIHDFGEAVTGDIPSFLKSEADESVEDSAVRGLLSELPSSQCEAFTALFDEMKAQKTPEARLWRALDKLEAVIQHNESPIATWLPLEYDLQKTYGQAETDDFPYLKALRAQLLADTEAKIQKGE